MNYINRYPMYGGMIIESYIPLNGIYFVTTIFSNYRGYKIFHNGFLL